MNKKLANREIIQQVDVIYKWLDEQLGQKPTAGICAICGRCCDFEAFGHRLYVTTPEMMYLADKLAGSDVIASAAKQSQTLEVNRLPRRPDKSALLAMTKNKMPTGRCSYQVKGKCSVYEYRFVACRIFCCKGDAGFQSELTEAVIKKFKYLCEKFKIPYRYVDLPTALRISPPHT